MLLRAELRALVAEQMRALMVAGGNVVENRSIPTTVAQLPIAILTTPAERKESRGPGAPKFLTTIHLVIDLWVSGNTEDAIDCLERIIEQTELAILANAVITRVIQEFSDVESHCSMSTLGSTPVARAQIIIRAAIPQVYDPAMPDRLLEIDIFRDPAMTTPGFEKIILPQ